MIQYVNIYVIQMYYSKSESKFAIAQKSSDIIFGMEKTFNISFNWTKHILVFENIIRNVNFPCRKWRLIFVSKAKWDGSSPYGNHTINNSTNLACKSHFWPFHRVNWGLLGHFNTFLTDETKRPASENHLNNFGSTKYSRKLWWEQANKNTEKKIPLENWCQGIHLLSISVSTHLRCFCVYRQQKAISIWLVQSIQRIFVIIFRHMCVWHSCVINFSWARWHIMLFHHWFSYTRIKVWG